MFGTTILYGEFSSSSSPSLRLFSLADSTCLPILPPWQLPLGKVQYIHLFTGRPLGDLLWHGGGPQSGTPALHLPLSHLPLKVLLSLLIPPLSLPGQIFDPSQAAPRALPPAEDGEDGEEGAAPAVSSLVWPEAASELAQRLVLHHLAGLPPGASLRDDARALMASQVRTIGKCGLNASPARWPVSLSDSQYARHLYINF